MARWYLCPTIHKIDPSISDTCWRCLRAPGTMIHIWGTCPRIIPFWDKILQLYDRLMGTKYPNEPHITVLSMLPGSYKLVKKSLIRHFLTAACSVIARHWRQAHTLSLADWACEIDRTENLEHMIAWDKNKSESTSFYGLVCCIFKTPLALGLSFLNCSTLQIFLRPLRCKCLTLPSHSPYPHQIQHKSAGLTLPSPQVDNVALQGWCYWSSIQCGDALRYEVCYLLNHKVTIKKKNVFDIVSLYC